MSLSAATEELKKAEDELTMARSEEGDQLRKLKKQTEAVKDSQKRYEESLSQTVKNMSFRDLGRQLKNDLLDPFRSFLSSIPKPLKTLGMLAMKPFVGKASTKRPGSANLASTAVTESFGGAIKQQAAGQVLEKVGDMDLPFGMDTLLGGSETKILGDVVTKLKSIFGELQIQTSWLENISSAVGGGDAQDLAIAENMARKDFDPGVRFDTDMQGGRWREYDSEEQQLGKMVSGERAEELGADKDRDTLSQTDLDAAKLDEEKRQSSLLEKVKAGIMSVVAGVKGLGEGPDASTVAETDLEKDTSGAVDAGAKKKPGGIFGKLQETFKKIVKKVKGYLKWIMKGGIFLVLPVILAFFNSDLWTTLKTTISEKLIPGLVKMWETLKPIATAIWNWTAETGLPIVISAITTGFEMMTELFNDINAALTGEGSIVVALAKNIPALLLISTLLFPSATFKLLISAVKGMMSALKAIQWRTLLPMTKELAAKGLGLLVSAARGLKVAMLAIQTTVLAPMVSALATGGKAGLATLVKAAQGLKVALLAIQTTVLAPMVAALAPALVAAAPFVAIAAAVALAVKSLYDAFMDAKAVFDETGDIWAAISEGLASFLATFLGFIPNIIKSIVAWAAEKLGFEGVAEWLRSFDIIDGLKNIFRTMFDGVFSFLGKLFTNPIELASSIWDAIKSGFSKIGEWIGSIFDIDWKALLSKFLPEKLVNYLMRDTEALDNASESGLYKEKGALRDSEIDRDMVGDASIRELKAIVADNDLSDEDMEFIKAALDKRELADLENKAALEVDTGAPAVSSITGRTYAEEVKLRNDRLLAEEQKNYQTALGIDAEQQKESDAFYAKYGHPDEYTQEYHDPEGVRGPHTLMGAEVTEKWHAMNLRHVDNLEEKTGSSSVREIEEKMKKIHGATNANKLLHMFNKTGVGHLRRGNYQQINTDEAMAKLAEERYGKDALAEMAPATNYSSIQMSDPEAGNRIYGVGAIGLGQEIMRENAMMMAGSRGDKAYQQLLSGTPTTADAANALYSNHMTKEGSAAGGGSSVVASIGGAQNNQSITVIQKPPASASDNHTTAQKRIGLQGRYAN